MGDGNSGKRVVIIGGGITGLASAYYLTKRGHEVIVLEKGGGPGHDSCSLGNAGLVVPSHIVPLAAPGMIQQGLRWMGDPESPFYVKPRFDLALLRWGWRFWRAATAAKVKRAMPVLCDLNLRSRQLFAELTAEDNGLAFGYDQRGLLMLYRSDEAAGEEEKNAERARSLGLGAETLSAAEVRERNPGVELEISGAVFYPDDGLLLPQVLISQLEARLGASLRWGSAVAGFERDGAGRVTGARLADGEIVEGDEFVIAGGVWSEAVAKLLGAKIPMQAGKGYSVTLEKPPALPAFPALLLEARVAVTPMGESLRFAGTMELAGLSTSINPRRVAGIAKSVGHYLPQFGREHFEGARPWAGLRPCSPDGLPYLGRLGGAGGAANVIVACGHGMLGLSLGPVTGEIVADLVDGEEPSIDIALLAPERYG